MKTRFFIMLVCGLLAGTTGVQAQGWLGKIKDKAGQIIKDKAEAKAKPQSDKTTRNDGDGQDNDGSADDKKSGGSATAQTAKNDFVPGTVVIFEDNLEGEQMGEFPSKWDLISNNAEVAKMNGKAAIRFEHGSDTEITPLLKDGNRKYLPEVYTLEFDYFITGSDDASSAYRLCLQGEDQNDGKYTEIMLGRDDAYWSAAKPGSDDGIEGHTSTQSIQKYNDWNHFALSFNKRALKVYLNGTRIINIPNMQAADWFTLKTEFWEDHVDYVTNVRLAKGGVELYDRNAQDMSAVEKAIIESGKFVTNNILFDTGKATLKPESMAEIQKVADYMKKNPSVRFEVQGHTDSQGSDKINDPLSQQRAEAIVKALVGMGCDEFNLRAVGKGSHEPVADNSTEEGRAKNRRVEFVKK